MNNLSDSVGILSVPYKSNEDSSVFISTDITQQQLQSFGIDSSEEAEGIRIDLFNQKDVNIFKTKVDFYTYSKKDDFDKPIIILDDKLLYENNEGTNFIFEIVKYSFMIFDFIKLKISAHQDVIKKQFILLSGKLGKDVIGYKNDHETNIDIDLHLKTKYEKLEGSSGDFLNFFKNSILMHIAALNNQDRYLNILTDFDLIYQNAERDFTFYQSKFSFSEFKNSLEIEKQKYLKETQDFISDFASKINLPIQFGVYIFLISRFSQEFYPLIATLVIIVSWSVFQLWSTFYTKNSLYELGESVNKSFQKIKNESKLELGDAAKEVSTKIEKAKNITVAYLWLTGLFSLAAIAINIYLLINLCTN